MMSSLSTGTTDPILRPIRRSVEITIVTLFAVLTIAVFGQVVARYVFNQPPAWTEELARFCQVCANAATWRSTIWGRYWHQQRKERLR